MLFFMKVSYYLCRRDFYVMDNLREWISSPGFSGFKGRTVLVRDLFVDYICFCKGCGNEGFATARGMSDYLKGIGYKKKRTCTGMAFIITE